MPFLRFIDFSVCPQMLPTQRYSGHLTAALHIRCQCHIQDSYSATRHTLPWLSLRLSIWRFALPTPLPPEEQRPIGIWGKRHLRYIKQHHKIRYTNLLTSCKLTAYLADIDQQAEELFFRLVKQLAEKEGVTEQLKAEDQMLWVQRVNNIRNRATEIVNAELIYV